MSFNLVAMDLWDDEAWFELAAARSGWRAPNGTLGWLPFALDYLAEIHIHAGELSQAAALMLERERIDPGTRAATLPYVPLLLAAWRGDTADAGDLAEAMARGAHARGEGTALTYADYARAVLHNGLGDYARPPTRRTAPPPPTRSLSRRGRCMSWWKPRCAATSESGPARRPTGCRGSPRRAAATGPVARRRGRARCWPRDAPPKTCTARPSTC